MNPRPKILIVDDEPFNVDYLEQELEEFDYDTVVAFNGRQALEQVAAEAPDVILLDIMMPEMDGFAVLEQLKRNEAWRGIPVIVISAMNDIDSVVRGIKLGAADYLPKPFNEILLHARIESGLERKRWRDKEMEYLRQVNRLTDAAQAVEMKTFAAQSLAPVAARDDALGNLARVFQRMAREVYVREQRLLQQIQQLQLDMDEQQSAERETVAAYLPIDRQLALTKGESLPVNLRGAVLFADISGFTPLTDALTRELGLQRGAEELTRYLNRVYGALIAEVHRFRGSVISFSGDAITCWFDDHGGAETPPAGWRATAAALAMQTAVNQLGSLTTPAGTTISLAIKIVVTKGAAHRFVVGDPEIQKIEVLAGEPLEELATGENLANRGQVLVYSTLAEALSANADILEWRTDQQTARNFAVVTGLSAPVAPLPWPDITVADELVRPWILPPVYARVHEGKGKYLAELRIATALFLQFGGIEYEGDEAAGAKLDSFVRWVQQVLARHGGHLLQLTIGEKGSYLYAAFGAPLAIDDDAVHAVMAAQELLAPPPELAFMSTLQIGLARGQMRTGAYGSSRRRTYGVLGEKTNLAARLMQLATENILCDVEVYRAAKSHVQFEVLPPVTVKGFVEEVTIYRFIEMRPAVNAKRLIDQLQPTQQLLLKVASLIGETFALPLLQAVYPIDADRSSLPEQLGELQKLDIIAPFPGGKEQGYIFTDPALQETAYQLMLFAQRRQLHRAVAEWYEQNHSGDLAPYYTLLIRHWSQAENPTKAVLYLEKAGEEARRQGNFQQAINYYNEALALEAQSAVLTARYHDFDDPY